MIQDKPKNNLINWEIVSVNPNDKKWNWKDIFCFWGNNIQSIIAFSLITSLYLVYDLNITVVFLGSLIASFFGLSFRKLNRQTITKTRYSFSCVIENISWI